VKHMDEVLAVALSQPPVKGSIKHRPAPSPAFA